MLTASHQNHITRSFSETGFIANFIRYIAPLRIMCQNFIQIEELEFC